jgi:hypothetical protein
LSINFSTGSCHTSSFLYIYIIPTYSAKSVA